MSKEELNSRFSSIQIDYIKERFVELEIYGKDAVDNNIDVNNIDVNNMLENDNKNEELQKKQFIIDPLKKLTAKEKYKDILKNISKLYPYLICSIDDIMIEIKYANNTIKRMINYKLECINNGYNNIKIDNNNIKTDSKNIINLMSDIKKSHTSIKNVLDIKLTPTKILNHKPNIDSFSLINTPNNSIKKSTAPIEFDNRPEVPKSKNNIAPTKANSKSTPIKPNSSKKSVILMRDTFEFSDSLNIIKKSTSSVNTKYLLNADDLHIQSDLGKRRLQVLDTGSSNKKPKPLTNDMMKKYGIEPKESYSDYDELLNKASIMDSNDDKSGSEADELNAAINPNSKHKSSNNTPKKNETANKKTPVKSIKKSKVIVDQNTPIRSLRGNTNINTSSMKSKPSTRNNANMDVDYNSESSNNSIVKKFKERPRLDGATPSKSEVKRQRKLNYMVESEDNVDLTQKLPTVVTIADDSNAFGPLILTRQTDDNTESEQALPDLKEIFSSTEINENVINPHLQRFLRPKGVESSKNDAKVARRLIRMQDEKEDEEDDGVSKLNSEFFEYYAPNDASNPYSPITIDNTTYANESTSFISMRYECFEKVYAHFYKLVHPQIAEITYSSEELSKLELPPFSGKCKYNELIGSMNASVVKKAVESSSSWRLEILNFLGELGPDLSKSPHSICKNYASYFSTYLYPILCLQTGINIDDVPEILNDTRLEMEKTVSKLDHSIIPICITLSSLDIDPRTSLHSCLKHLVNACLDACVNLELASHARNDLVLEHRPLEALELWYVQNFIVSNKLANKSPVFYLFLPFQSQLFGPMLSLLSKKIIPFVPIMGERNIELADNMEIFLFPSPSPSIVINEIIDYMVYEPKFPLSFSFKTLNVLINCESLNSFFFSLRFALHSHFLKTGLSFVPILESLNNSAISEDKRYKFIPEAADLEFASKYKVDDYPFDMQLVLKFRSSRPFFLFIYSTLLDYLQCSSSFPRNDTKIRSDSIFRCESTFLDEITEIAPEGLNKLFGDKHCSSVIGLHCLEEALSQVALSGDSVDWKKLATFMNVMRHSMPTSEFKIVLNAWLKDILNPLLKRDLSGVLLRLISKNSKDHIYSCIYTSFQCNNQHIINVLNTLKRRIDSALLRSLQPSPVPLPKPTSGKKLSQVESAKLLTGNTQKVQEELYFLFEDWICDHLISYPSYFDLTFVNQHIALKEIMLIPRNIIINALEDPSRYLPSLPSFSDNKNVNVELMSELDDVVIAYQLLEVYGNKITVDSWFNDFKDAIGKVEDIPDATPDEIAQVRFEKCISELHFLGLIQNLPRNRSTITKLTYSIDKL